MNLTEISLTIAAQMRRNKKRKKGASLTDREDNVDDSL